MAEDPDLRSRPELGLAAWLETIDHVGARRGAERLKRADDCWLLEARREVTNPFPRRFPYRKNIYTLEKEPEQIREQARAWLDPPNEAHVLHVFGSDAEAIAGRLAPHGYQLSWTYSLFGFELGGHLPEPELADPRWVLRPVASLAEIEAINANDPPYPSHPELLGDPAVFETMVFAGEKPISKGHLVQSPSGIVHVLGMYTLPEQRQRGLARAIIRALHREARARDCSWSVLNASLEAARADVYPKLGYQTLLSAARLIPVAID